MINIINIIDLNVTSIRLIKIDLFIIYFDIVNLTKIYLDNIEKVINNLFVKS